ncbi:hypothetical protein PLESTB_001813600 [Pleodorina starrii]|uniref:Uncharacterized protein n=1 Tax=Pleodorina starrii TaxID=330485 RepID=A0A9W6FAN6_9CHLO|nr:hypothetical protein PLESTM_001399600 [Pleodorina starrii]GLC61876.1 hypothetical protein PLESTB_001813600 [Pleodorina starrii]GLC75925.1 hypothetical protein PLESTF_001706600 [Pleodorina starrii]
MEQPEAGEHQQPPVPPVQPLAAPPPPPPQQQQQELQFSVDWMAPHLPYWRQHVVSRFGGRPNVRVLEIGCWEGRSALWLLRNVADHPTSSLVCIDPFEICHPPFLRNRRVFESNLRAAGEWSRVTHMHMESRQALPRLIVDAWDAAAAESAPGGGGAAAAADPAPSGGGTVEAGPPVPPVPLPAPAQSPCPSCALFDLVYVDGSHMRADVLTDAVMAWQLLKVGGVLVFDDYLWDQYADNPVCHPAEAVDAFLRVFAHQLHVLSRGYQIMLERVAS